MSREDHRNYDEALRKARAEAEAIRKEQPKFKWQDSLTLVGVVLTIVAFVSEDTPIVIGCFILSALLICLSVYSHKEWTIWRYVISLLVIVLFSALSFRAYTKAIERELSLLHGRLIPAGQPDLPNSCPLDDDELAVYIGQDIAIKASRFPLTVLRIAGKPAIVMNRNLDRSVSLSLEVRSVDGRIITKLDGNVFTINQNNYLSKEPGDRSTLSVIDQNGKRVLYAHYLNPHTFQLDAHMISDGRTVDLATLPFSGFCMKVEHGPEGAAAFGVD